MRLGVPIITDMYHLTSKNIYNQIIGTERIIAMSHPFWRSKYNEGALRNIMEGIVRFDEIEKIMGSDRYIVGFLDPVPIKWISSGLMKYVIGHVQNKSAGLFENSSGPVYSFHMEVDTKRLFVRNHYFTSPEYYKQHHGKDYWDLLIRKKTNVLQSKELKEGIAKYFNSSVTMYEYLKSNLNYEVPELWYAGDYLLKPFDGIKELSSKAVTTLRGE